MTATAWFASTKQTNKSYKAICSEYHVIKSPTYLDSGMEIIFFFFLLYTGVLQNIETTKNWIA